MKTGSVPGKASEAWLRQRVEQRVGCTRNEWASLRPGFKAAWRVHKASEGRQARPLSLARAAARANLK